MQFDGTLLAIAGLILTALSVIGPFLAPRLIRGARLQSGVISVDRISRSAPGGEFRVEVYHKDKKIDDSLFVARGYVSNSGTKDITRDHFVDPVEIFTDNPSLEMLSFELSSPEGVRPEIKERDDRWHLFWSILKPKEKISFISVIKASDPKVKIRDIESSFTVQARLVDVKSGQQALDRFSVPAFLVGLALFSILIGGMLYFEGVHPREAIAVDRSAGEFLIQKDLSFKVCVVSRKPVYFSNCRDANDLDLGRIRPGEGVEKIRTGVGQFVVWLFVPIGFLYALLFGFTAARPSAMRHFIRTYSNILGGRG